MLLFLKKNLAFSSFDYLFVFQLKRMFRKEVGKKMTENADTQSNNSQSTEKTHSMEGTALFKPQTELNCQSSYSM